MNQNILFIGMDVHKESIEIDISDGSTQETRRYGRIGGTRDAMRKALAKLTASGKSLHFCYEAGPCGYELYRYLIAEGHICCVVAPSLIPKKPGDKVKTDKRDAIQLARLFRAGELTPVYVPNRDDEAIRDLSRAREDTMLVQKAARQRLKSFLLRHDIRYSGKSSWTDCKSVGSGEKALIYLGRYLYRGVIQEKDIIDCKDGKVTFRFQNSRTKKAECRTVSGEEFLWLLLQHVLPKGFRRARNFGFLHPNSKRLIRLIQYLLGLDPGRALGLMKKRPQWVCPCCGARMKVLETRLTPLFTFSHPPAT